MSLPDDYLVYPRRGYGMDQDRYDWRPATQRLPVTWPAAKPVAAMIVIPIEHHPLDPSSKPFKHPGAMVTPYPDLRHYTTRDYGNRVGVFRILKALRAHGLKATVPVNARQLVRLRPLIDAVLADGHEIAAYGLATDHIHWGGMERDTEAAWIKEVRDLFAAAGLTPRCWMSPARQQSFDTLDLIAGAGFDVCLDWEQDETPTPMRTKTGSVSAVPLFNELDDRLLLIDKRQTEDEWARQILEAAAFLASDPQAGGRVLSFTLTPYVTGQPFRMPALRRVLQGLASDTNVWSATASQIADAA